MNPVAVQTKSNLDLGEIKTVAVIDDVFDFPDITHLNHGELNDFFAALDSNDIAQAELSQLNLGISRDSGLENDQLQKLWHHFQGDEKTELAKLCISTLFANIIQDWNEVMCFCKYLETELNLTTIKLGTSNNLDDHQKEPIKLIFIDYYLGPDIQPIPINDSTTETRIPAKERSIDFVKKIKANPTDNTKPFVILMSSKEINLDMVGQFRDATGWLEGMFYFIPKSDFNQKQHLSILLGALAKYLPIGYKIQHFVEVLDASLNVVMGKFLSDIRTLSLPDYAYIQKMSLLTDGHPLGDYMLWLYGSYLSYLLFESEKPMSEQCSEMNRLSFQNLPTVQIAPSQQLVKIYKSALFDDTMGDVVGHPLAKRNSQEMPSAAAISGEAVVSDELEQPYLQLGDLFVNSSSNAVLMIINAQCDLAFSPNGKRPIPPERSIVLIQGKLQPLIEPIREPNQMRTELFEYRGEKYRILWEIKQIVSYSYKDVVSCLKKDGYMRTARLRQLYALEIQHAFASNLTRVGMPVPPPVYQPLQVCVFSRGEDGNHKKILESTGGMAYLAKTREDEQCILTLDLVKHVVDIVISLATKIEEELITIDPAQPKAKKKIVRLNKRRDEFYRVVDSSQEWLQLLSPFELKYNGEKLFPNLPVKVSRGKTTDGSYGHEQAVLISVSDVLDEKEQHTVEESG